MRSPFTYLVSLAALLLALIILTSGAFSATPFALPDQGSEEPRQAAPTQQPVAPAGNENVSLTEYFSALTYRAMRMQQEYFRGLAKAFRSFDLERSFDAAFALISISFAYGIFHAVGPGHGKFIVSSYLLADERDVKRGIGLAFASSFAQAITAIVIVGALAIVLGLTHRAVADSVPTIERVSFLFVIGVGAVLLWRALRPVPTHDDHKHDHSHDHDHDGHAHIPPPAELRKIHDWRDMAGIILAVGLRPCTGAILVLLFALTQGAFMVGALSSFAMSLGTAITVSVLAVLTLVSKNVALRIAGTADNRWTSRIERGLKIAGGFFILAMGLFMLAGSFMLPAQPLL